MALSLGAELSPSAASKAGATPSKLGSETVTAPSTGEEELGKAMALSLGEGLSPPATSSAGAACLKLASKTVELDPSADNHFMLGWACDVNGDSEGALAALQRAIQLDPDNPKYKQAYQTIEERETPQ